MEMGRKMGVGLLTLVLLAGVSPVRAVSSSSASDTWTVGLTDCQVTQSWSKTGGQNLHVATGLHCVRPTYSFQLSLALSDATEGFTLARDITSGVTAHWPPGQPSVSMNYVNLKR